MSSAPAAQRLAHPRAPAFDRHDRRSNVGPLTVVVGAAVGYYVGSLVGLTLRLPSMTPSVLWPPNAVLTGALLLAPPRWWAAVLLGALPAHLAAQATTEWPLTLVLGFFVTNCAEALLAASGVRLLSDSPSQLKSLRSFGAFLLAAVLVAPLVSTFLDAAVVAWVHREPYLLIWRNRLPSNMLAQLTVTPAVLAVATRAGAWLRAPLSKYVEAGALATGLLLSATFAFEGSTDAASFLTTAPLVAQLPFMVWAAMRFGASVAALAVLLVTGVTTSWAVDGSEVFGAIPAERLVTNLQLFLMTIAATVLGLATLTEDRRAAMTELAERLRFERLLSEFSRAFLKVSSERTLDVCQEWLGRFGTALAVDCVCVLHGDLHADITIAAEWKRRTQLSDTQIVLTRDYPWVCAQLQARETVLLSSLRDLPRDVARDRHSFEAQGLHAVVVLPIVANEQFVGALSVGSAGERTWSDEVIGNLRMISDVVANALARVEADRAVRSSELMKSAILESLLVGVGVVDATGRLLDVNTHWHASSRESHLLRQAGSRIGDNMLETLSAEAADGVRAVLDRTKPRFWMEYATPAAEGTRWWLFVAHYLQRKHGGAVLTLTDVTERRRAEIEAQQSRQALAHVGRVSTMGELTASLAHQLNQPLTGIMSNAQAARRLLDAGPAERHEVREALFDIIDDARRAKDVVAHVRQLLRRSDVEMTPTDLNEVIRTVANLVHSDAVIRNAALTLDLDAQPLVISGNRVQLEQLLLNLLVNALEAVGDNPGERAIHVSCRRDGSEARAAVRDTGAGLPPGTEQLVFDPFYTTKAHGMGIGLSVARSIVQAHGGSIRASRDDMNRTVFEFSLPLSGAEAG